MKEFAETKGNNIKQFTLTQKAQKKTDLVVSKDEELSKPHFQMGNTILSEDFNEFSIQGKSKVNKNTSHESQKNVLSQNVNISLQDKVYFLFIFLFFNIIHIFLRKILIIHLIKQFKV